MSCPEARSTLKYMRGELSDRHAQRSAEHLHQCSECRETMKFGASAWMSARREADESSEASGAHESLRPAPRAFGFRNMFIGRPVGAESRPRSRWMLMLLVGAAALFFMTWKSEPASASALATPELPPEERALQDGMAWLESPRGQLTGRPRVVSALIPGGVERFRVLIVDAEGAVLLNEQHRAGEGGVLAADEGAHQRVLVPFPASTVLPLPENAAFGLSVILPGGRVAASARFSLVPAEVR